MLIIGHRGAKGLAPENTIAAIDKAIEFNADIIEVDVRVTKDNIVIINHDSTIKSGETFYKIKENTYKDLKKLKKDLPTLKEVMKHVNGRSKLDLDVKPKEDTLIIAKVISPFLIKQYTPDDLYISSMSQSVLLSIHALLPELPIIVLESWSGFKAVRRAKELKTPYIAMNQRNLWWGFIKFMSKRPEKLMVYTLNDPRKALRWEKLGLFGVITDCPHRFDKVLFEKIIK